jgi:hypothetical protein
MTIGRKFESVIDALVGAHVIPAPAPGGAEAVVPSILLALRSGNGAILAHVIREFFIRCVFSIVPPAPSLSCGTRRR